MNFVSRVMAIPPRLGSQAPKPKGKKRGAAKKLRSGRPDVKPLDVFKVVLEADAGKDSSSNQRRFFDDHLASCSEAELEKLKKKIEVVRSRCLEEERDQIEQAEIFIEEAIARRLELSNGESERVREQIADKLEGIGILRHSLMRDLELEPDREKQRALLRKFAKAFFKEEIALYNDLLLHGRVIPERKHMRGTGFTARALRKLIEADFLDLSPE